MSSKSGKDAEMQFDMENVVCTGLNVPVEETLAEPASDDRSLTKNIADSDKPSAFPKPDGGGYDGFEEGSERERDCVGMEVEFIEQSDSRVVLGHSECSERKRVSLNSVDEGNSGAFSGKTKCLVDGEADKSAGMALKDDSGANSVSVEGAVKASFNSFAQQLFPKSLNHDDRLPCMNKTIDGNGAEVEDSSVLGYHVAEGGFSDSNEVRLVVDLEACLRKNRKEKDGFCASDLVWGKVKSHPWWPGQIFEAGDASDKARKYFRSNSYLVAYFGDHTFAWNEAPKLKPFVPYFSQMVKQTGMEAFRHAVDCALDEVSRRVEFRLSCHCIADDDYSRLKTQVVENAGIREQSRVQEDGARFFTALSFEAVKFLDYVKDLAQGKYIEVDRLEYIVAQAQMSAFYRRKGYYHLAEFGSLIGFLNSEADAPSSVQKKEIYTVIADGSLAPQGTIEEKDDSKPLKRKRISGASGLPTKKKRHLSDLVAKKGSYKEDDVEEKTSSFRRQKAAKLLSETEDCSLQLKGKTSVSPGDSKPSFRVGESILRVAGQLNQRSPVLKLDAISHGKTVKTKSGSKKSRKQAKVVPFKDSSPDVTLSQLRMAAIEPLKDHSSLSSMVGSFSGFRNSVVQDSELSQKHVESGRRGTVGKSEERLFGSEPAEMGEGYSFNCKSEDDACDKIISVFKTPMTDENEAPKVDGTSGVMQEICKVDGKVQEEDSPTALTLKFTDIDSIPPEAKLNKIFSHFGPLKESETEVLTKKNIARVVFKRRLDAETAFSSSGKFETFGPSLVCYRLNYAPTPRKYLSVEAQTRKKS